MTVDEYLSAPATGPGSTARRHGRARLVIGYLSIAAILPYFILKLAWVAGSTAGIATASPIDADVLWGGNAVTMALEVVAAFIILAFTHSWGLRAPAWLVLAPAWVGTGLLAPFVVTGPVVAGSGSGGDGSLAPWVGPLVYLGFGAQAIGIAVTFILYVRARWPQALGGRMRDRSGGPYQPALVFLLGVMIALLAVVTATRVIWAAGSDSGLSADQIANRGAAEWTADAGTALFAVAAAIGLWILVRRRPGRMPTWVPLAMAWIGGGAVFGTGLYPMVLLLIGTAGLGPAGSGEGLVPFVNLTQVVVGTVAAVTGIFLLVDLNGPAGGAQIPSASRE
ncbi:hypothetical protein [Acidipropionibacterium virtanenii]|uniref:LigA protein n=1 Tax=Acidipropionibacterium virtanenii TaxID=2057246 RepID=A0A344URX5_9ACTN|nr:hypothetical protein [Acidipropionibacterium virtanenii]AXE38023.1 hypothetical protein JS278_00836 [Acidipropionibacterium virtanenii]